MPNLVRLAAAVLLPSIAAIAQGGVSWQSGASNSPLAPRESSLAFDRARGVMVLFGGIDGGFLQQGPFQDTWELSAGVWTQRYPVHAPPPGLWHLVYHDARQRVLAFAPSFALQPPWEWDGNDWVQLGPSPVGGSVTYDVARQRIVLVGSAGGSPLETWEWDGASWTLAATSTPAGVIAYDEARQVCVGLRDGSPPETWEWNGTSWLQRVTPTTPAPGLAYHLAYDPVRATTLAYGFQYGSGGQVAGGEVFELRGQAWQLLTVAVPPAIGVALAYDPSTERLLTFGGKTHWWLGNHSNTTSALASVSPTNVSPYGAGCAGALGTPTLTAAAYSRPWLGDTFRVELASLAGGCLPLMMAGTAPANVNLTTIGLSGCTQWVVPILVDPLPLLGSSAAWSLVIPQNTTLIGSVLHLQGAALLAGGSNPLGAAMSNGMAGVLGMR